MDYFDTFVSNCKADLKDNSRTYCYNYQQVEALEKWAKKNNYQYKIEYNTKEEFWCFMCHTRKNGTPYWLRYA